MDSTLIYLAAFVAMIAAAIALAILAVRRDGRNVGELLIALVIWVSIVGLMPMVGMAGANLIHPLKARNDLEAKRGRIQSEIHDNGKEPTVIKGLRDQMEGLDTQIREETRRYNRAMFWIAFPVGFVAFVIGFFLPPLPVGTAMSLGGVCTLAMGCYTYWDDMGDGMRFVSLLLTLIVMVGLGLWRYRRRPEAVVPALDRSLSTT